MKTPSENRSAETVIVYPAEAKSPKEERGIPGVSDAGKPGECFRCLSIIGQIEGHYVLGEGQKATRYEQIIPLLVDAEEDERVDGLLIILNTMGGDVEAGLALAELIASMSKPTVTLVLGGGHSIGVPLATAGKVSMIVPSATMTLHPVRVSGTVIGVPQSFKSMEEMQDRIIGFICKHSKAKPDALRALMTRQDQIANDCGTVIDGEKAVEIGLIDRIGGLSDALDELRKAARERRGKTSREKKEKRVFSEKKRENLEIGIE